MAGTDIDVERLINAVAEHPELWDTACDSYKDRQKKASAWVTVSRVVYPEYETWSDKEQKLQTREVIVKWRTVRDNYTRVLKKDAELARSGSAARRGRSYVYAEQLSFLRRTLEPRPMASSIDVPSTSGAQRDVMPCGSATCSEDVEQGGGESHLEEEETAAQEPDTARSDTTRPAPKRRRPPGTEFEHAMVTFMDAHQPAPPPPPQCRFWDDDDMTFHHSCLPMLHQMSLAQKMEYRRRTLDTIDDILSRPPVPPVPRSGVAHTQYAGGYYRQPQPRHQPISPGARSQPPPGSEYYQGHMPGPYDQDPQYEDL